MDLPSGSPLIVNTLESPWFLAALLLIAGGIAWFGFRYRYPRRAPMVAGVLIAAALGLVALGALVETTGERLARETRSLVEAAVAGDAVAFGGLLEDGLVLRVGRDKSSLDKADLLDRVKGIKALVQSNNIRDARGVRTGADTGESVLAQTTTTAMGQPTPNEWRFRWRKDAAGGWRVTEMIWEKWGFNEVPSADMLRN